VRTHPAISDSGRPVPSTTQSNASGSIATSAIVNTNQHQRWASVEGSIVGRYAVYSAHNVCHAAAGIVAQP
jgi:hypothetical protein